jgi:hypothetical protein
MRFNIQNVCDRQGCEVVVVADGLLDRDAAEQFKRLLPSIPSQQTVIEFNSLGGDLVGSLALGQAIRQAGLNTRIRYAIASQDSKPQNKDPAFAQCYSACALAFLGGVQRQLDPRARYGLHALQGNKDQGIDLVHRYLDRMGVDRRMTDYLLLARGQQVNLINTDSAKRLNIDNQGATGLAVWKVQSTKQGAQIALITEKQLKPNVIVTLGLSRIQDDFQLIVHIKPVMATNETAWRNLLIEKNPKISMRLGNNRRIDLVSTKKWFFAKEGYQSWWTIKSNDLLEISRRPDFELSVEGVDNSGLFESKTKFGNAGLDLAIKRLLN